MDNITQNITLIKDDIVWVIVLGTISVYQLTTASQHTLLTLIVAFGFAYVAWKYLDGRSRSASTKLSNKREVFNKDVTDRTLAEQASKAFAGGKARGKMKYLFKNEALFEIAQQLFFVRIFDKMKYADILMAMEDMQREYVKILESRVNAKQHVDIFLDAAKRVLQHIYSLHFSIPRNMKYIYGVSPHDVLEKNVMRFIGLKGRMTKVLESFCRKEKGLPYFPDQSPEPSDAPFDFIKSRELP